MTINPNIGDRVYIIETGDPAIDRFIDQPMVVIDADIQWADWYTFFWSYTLQSRDGGTCSVLDCEMEYRNV